MPENWRDWQILWMLFISMESFFPYRSLVNPKFFIFISVKIMLQGHGMTNWYSGLNHDVCTLPSFPSYRKMKFSGLLPGWFESQSDEFLYLFWICDLLSMCDTKCMCNFEVEIPFLMTYLFFHASWMTYIYICCHKYWKQPFSQGALLR